MDTSSPAVFVNSELLKMYLGRRVRAVVQVLQNDGGTMTGQSTDGQQLLVKGSPTFPKSHFVESVAVNSNAGRQQEQHGSSKAQRQRLQKRRASLHPPLLSSFFAGVATLL
ncbi:hypothetical protein Taro_023366 [Colocasia esculenta]|uniref:Uncharacterized protein n=1 Tax=Colocasia esculenta TaxID=4460 RepID=A0A843UX67_COLES|nr:hypothetical protein [Colocasia esculenta]